MEFIFYVFQALINQIDQNYHICNKMNFNIDFLANQMRKKSHRKVNVEELRQFVSIINDVEKKIKKMLPIYAFHKILVSRRPRVQKLVFVERMAKQRLKDALFQLKQFSSLNKKQVLSKNKLLNYPVAILQKWISNKAAKDQRNAFTKLKKNRLFLMKVEHHLDSMNKVQKEYIRRNYEFNLMKQLKSNSTKKLQYQSHLDSFQYLFECIRIRILFETFTTLSIKTLQRNIVDLQKKRNSKKDSSRTVTIKRNEVTNQLKRKINNLMGQINQNQINNNRRKVNGIRENGFKLIKINQQIRVTESSADYLQYEVEKLQKQINRKQSYIDSRGQNTMRIEQLKELYQQVGQTQENTTKQSIEQIVSQREQDQFQSTLNYLVKENAQLKHQMNLFEKMSSTKKQSYTIAEHQNSFIKEIISSIIHHHLMNDQAAEMMQVTGKIWHHAKQYKVESRRIKSSSRR